MTVCKQCTKCCRHVALPIDTPRSKSDYKDIIWYVMHENVRVFKDDENDWYIEFETPCKALDKKGNCKIYTERPDICKDYSAENCENNGIGSPYKILLKTKKDVEEHIKKNTRIKSL